MGYKTGFSMSDNAVMAYENGEKPLSRWAKKDILEAIEKAVTEGSLTLKCSMETLKKVSVEVLRSVCLYKSSWHHTSNHYNKTDFYSLDLEEISEMTDEKLQTLMKNSKDEVKENVTEERWKCAFLEWSGSRNYPKATEHIEEGIVRGNWFIRADGSKKKTTASGFRFIEKIEAKKDDIPESGIQKEKAQRSKPKKVPQVKGPRL